MITRILVIGGTGVFGQRLCRHLATQVTGIKLIITSRNKKKAQLQAERFQKLALDDNIVIGHSLNTQSDSLSALLSDVAPAIVVDCSGPFQLANYSTARIAIEAGAYYLDLADARDYLSEFKEQLNTRAGNTQTLAVAGCSSTPTLSMCVVRSLIEGWQRTDTIDIAITPGGRSEVGESVVSAILSYTGKPIPCFSNGEFGTTTGWGTSRPIAITGLGKRIVSPVETLDAELLSVVFQVKSRVSFSAGLESILEHRSLQVLSWLSKLNVIRSPQRLASLLIKARKISRITTSNRGGMIVIVTGLNENGFRTRSQWSLLAENDDGPYVPILPAAAVTRRILSAEPVTGAMLGGELLQLSDIEIEMSPYAISTQTDTVTAQRSIFERSLTEQTFSRMPSALQSFHGVHSSAVWIGKGTVRTGSWASKIIAKVFGFPAAGDNIPITVTVDHELDKQGQWHERWTRIFAGSSFSSILKINPNNQLTECFWPFTFNLGVTANDKQLTMPVTGWRIGKIPLPKFLAPVSEAIEYENEQGQFCFDVKLSHPLIGLIAHYQGWLQSKE